MNEPRAATPDRPGTEAVPFLERWGIARVSTDASTARPSIDAVHELNDEEHRALRAVERGAIARAALAGVLSAVASGITEAVAGHHFKLDHRPTWADLAAYFSLYGLVTLVASVAEIAFLYWDALRSVRMLAEAAGARVDGRLDDRHSVAAALARAALELPDPDAPVHGVDPRRESSQMQLLLASTFYKLKVGLSSFVFKAVLRRALGRLATRQLLAFAAVPVNAVWNGLVTFFVLREARIRLIGPSAAVGHLDALLGPKPLSAEGRVAVLTAAASAIVRSEHAHPNLVFLLRRLIERLGPVDDAMVIDDAHTLVARALALSSEERAAVLRVFVFAGVLDGRLARRERALIRELRQQLGLPGDVRDVERLRRDLVEGRPLTLA